jgi:hypothetical protein
MKKIALITLLSTVAFSGFAADTITPEQVKEQWIAMTPEQQQAAMTYMKQQGQEKQTEWQSLTPEEQQAKKDAAKTNAQSSTSQTQMQSRMQAMQQQMSSRMMNRGNK